MIRPGCTVLSVTVWDKVEGVGEGRPERTAKPKPEGFAPYQPGSRIMLKVAATLCLTYIAWVGMKRRYTHRNLSL